MLFRCVSRCFQKRLTRHVHYVQGQSPSPKIRSLLEESLSTSVIEEEPISYHFFEHGSKRGGKLLVSSDGFKFNMKKEQKNSILWACNVRSKKIRCHATVIQKGEDYSIGSHRHNHPPETGALSRVKVSVQVKTLAQRHLYKSAGELVEDAVQELVPTQQPNMLKPSNVARAANRMRARMRPDAPRDLSFEVDMNYLQCEEFLVGDIIHGSERHMIFATHEQLRLLRQTRRWFMDGTFKILGKPFQSGQLMSIHGFVNSDGETKQVPMAFILMSRRRREDYEIVFKKIKEIVNDYTVEGFVLDFEPAAWLAVRSEFPGVCINGCVFHWTQAVWRKAQEIGLKPEYEQRSTIYNYIRRLLALPFLPSEHIEPAFRELEARANTPKLRSLVGYMDRTWFGHRIFTVESWCVYRHTVRTNNDVEGYHHRLNSRAGNNALTFYRLIPVLRKESEMVHYHVRVLTDGQGGRTTRPTYRRVETRVNELWDREYFYFIDHQGQLFLDDSKMKNFTSCFKEKKFLDFFFSRLRMNETGSYMEDFPYLSPCGRERNYIRCDDQPIVFVHLTDNQDGSSPDVLSYGYAGTKSLCVTFEPEKVCMLPESGRIYHPADPEVGGVGLIKSSIAIAISKYFDFENGEEEPPTHFTWQGKKHTLTNEIRGLMKTETRDTMVDPQSKKDGNG